MFGPVLTLVAAALLLLLDGVLVSSESATSACSKTFHHHAGMAATGPGFKWQAEGLPHSRGLYDRRSTP